MAGSPPHLPPHISGREKLQQAFTTNESRRLLLHTILKLDAAAERKQHVEQKDHVMPIAATIAPTHDFFTVANPGNVSKEDFIKIGMTALVHLDRPLIRCMLAGRVGDYLVDSANSGLLPETLKPAPDDVSRLRPEILVEVFRAEDATLPNVAQMKVLRERLQLYVQDVVFDPDLDGRHGICLSQDKTRGDIAEAIDSGVPCNGFDPKDLDGIKSMIKALQRCQAFDTSAGQDIVRVGFTTGGIVEQAENAAHRDMSGQKNLLYLVDAISKTMSPELGPQIQMHYYTVMVLHKPEMAGIAEHIIARICGAYAEDGGCNISWAGHQVAHANNIPHSWYRKYKQEAKERGVLPREVAYESELKKNKEKEMEVSPRSSDGSGNERVDSVHCSPDEAVRALVRSSDIQQMVLDSMDQFLDHVDGLIDDGRMPQGALRRMSRICAKGLEKETEVSGQGAI
ncbi:hypothetical protein B9Z65_6890 [Elsinoe australis]|uniref:Uncharacterized protein n=1 Tax=Elsinoe australis TaxID=40998 RepID=A0A2P7Z3Z0_9PEZI|nr:hypothetical protein B9Z65_6890 [Elsinoe australis]